MCITIRRYEFSCGCSIFNGGQVLGVKYDKCQHYDAYNDTLQFCDATSANGCLQQDGSGYLPNVCCWAHNKLRRQGKDTARMEPLVYESPCEWANSGDFVQDEGWKRTRELIYAQADTAICLDLLAEAFRGLHPKRAWELVERQLAAANEEKVRLCRRLGSAPPRVAAPRILRPIILEYLD